MDLFDDVAKAGEGLINKILKRNASRREELLTGLIAGEEIRAGELVIVDQRGGVRVAGFMDPEPSDIALPPSEEELLAATRREQAAIASPAPFLRHQEHQYGRASASYAFSSSQCYGSVSYGAIDIGRLQALDLSWNAGPGVTGIGSTHKFGFSDEIIEKAWALVQEYMTDAQWRHFKGGKAVELVNTEETYRILLSTQFFTQNAKRPVTFTILKGDLGEGLVVSQGKITQRKYPIGDEVTTFLAWFTDRTEELIEKWNCGTYAIVEEGKKQW